MINRGAVKEEARRIIMGARVSPILVTLLVMVIVFVLERVTDLVEGGSLFYSYGLAGRYYDALISSDPGDLEALLYSLPRPTGMTFFFSVLVSLVGLVLNGGYYIYCMGIRRGVEMPCAALADGLGVAGKLIWIPGIVALYRYRFAYYNILTDESITAGGAIRLSCQQTRGMKMELFILDLSFIGWSLLSALTMGLLNVWLTPYITLCDLAYFEEGQRRVGRGAFNGGQRPPEGDPWGSV